MKQPPKPPKNDPTADIEELPSIHEPAQRHQRVHRSSYILSFFLVWLFLFLLDVEIERPHAPSFLQFKRLYMGNGLITLPAELPDDRVLAEQMGVPLSDVLTAQRTLGAYHEYLREQPPAPTQFILRIPVGDLRLVLTWRILFDGILAFAIASVLYLREKHLASEHLIEAQNRKYQQLNRALEAKVREGLKIIDELNQTQDRLVTAEKLASIGRLSATLAHEIRNPLSIIKSALGIVEEDLAEKDASADTFELIKGEISRLDDLISDLLNFARPKPPNLGRHDIVSLVRHWIPPIVEELEKSGVQLVPQLEKEPGEVYADADQLYQVFLNLIWNARDALTGQPNPHIFIRTEDGGPNFLKLIIQDTGPGMLPEVVEQIKEPFFTTKTHGSGLGIPVSIQLVEGMHGEFLINSVPEWGTEVILVLPRGDYGERLDSMRRSSAGSDSRQMKTLSPSSTPQKTDADSKIVETGSR